jgi:hypothetical protein
MMFPHIWYLRNAHVCRQWKHHMVPEVRRGRFITHKAYTHTHAKTLANTEAKDMVCALQCHSNSARRK